MELYNSKSSAKPDNSKTFASYALSEPPNFTKLFGPPGFAQLDDVKMCVQLFELIRCAKSDGSESWVVRKVPMM